MRKVTVPTVVTNGHLIEKKLWNSLNDAELIG